MIKLLVEKGAIVNKQFKNNYTPLMKSVNYGHCD